TGFGAAKLALNAAMGVEGAADYDVSPEEGAALPEESLRAADLHADALKARPEYRRAQAQVELEESGRRTAQAGYLPSLVASGNFAGSKVGDFRAGYNWFVGLGLTWNPVAGILAKRQIEETEARVESASAALAGTRQGILVEIEQQLL